MTQARSLSPPAIRIVVAVGVLLSLGWGFSGANQSDSPPRHGLTANYYGPHLGSSWIRYDFQGVLTDRYGIPSPAPGKKPEAVRIDSQIAFGRDRGFVGQTWLEPAETAAVIWTGTIRLPKAGTYYFVPVSYNSSAVFVNEARVALNGFLGGVIPTDAFVYEHLRSSGAGLDERRLPANDLSYLVPVIVDGPRDFPIEVRLSTRNPSAYTGFGIDLYWVTPDSPRDESGKPIATIVPGEAFSVEPPHPVERSRVSAAHSTVSSDFLYLPRDKLTWATLPVRLADDQNRGVPGRRVHVSAVAEHGRSGAAFVEQPERPTDENGVTTARVNMGPRGSDITLFATDQNEAVDVAQAAEIVAGPTLENSFLPATLAPYYDDRKFLVEPLPLAVGKPATIRTPLVNRTEKPVELTATFSMKSLNIGARDWNEIGRASIALQPGETKEVHYTWTPEESTGHVCFKIEIGGRYRSEPARRAGLPFPVAAIFPASNGATDNVPVDSLTRNIGPVAPGSPCDDGAAKMRKEYRELGRELARRLPNVAPDEREQFRQQRLNDYADLQERWEALKAECDALGIDIGDLEGNELPSSPPGEFERRQKEWKEEADRLSNVGRDFARHSRLMGEVYSKLGDVGGEIIGGPAGGVFGLAVDSIAKGEMEKHAKTWDAWSDRWEGAANDPPSPDYQSVIEPKLQPMQIPAEAGVVERLSGKALEARNRENAYLHAWVGSYERYQGAEAANDVGAMSRQAEAMARFARSAIGETRMASRLAYDFEQTLLTAFLERSRTLTDSEEARQRIA
ncbi:MAG TPA: hypothetical protein VMS56_14485, partial [Thermoanaerobaculia bacterium]|nr:hypothetical protein [Thermoanaerobaculia bacterium]